MDNWNENDKTLNNSETFSVEDTMIKDSKPSLVFDTIEDALGIAPKAAEPAPVQPAPEAPAVKPAQPAPEVPTGVNMTSGGIMYKHIDNPDPNATKTLNIDPALYGAAMQQTPQAPVHQAPQTPVQPMQQTPVRPAAPMQQTPVRPAAPMQQTPGQPSAPAAPVMGSGFVMKDAPAQPATGSLPKDDLDNRPLSYWGERDKAAGIRSAAPAASGITRGGTPEEEDPWLFNNEIKDSKTGGSYVGTTENVFANAANTPNTAAAGQPESKPAGTGYNAETARPNAAGSYSNTGRPYGGGVYSNTPNGYGSAYGQTGNRPSGSAYGPAGTTSNRPAVNTYGPAGGYSTSGSYGGNGGSGGSGSTPTGKAAKPKPSTMQISKRAFVLLLILAMLLTTIVNAAISTAINRKSLAALPEQTVAEETTASSETPEDNTGTGSSPTDYTLNGNDQKMSYNSIISKTQDSVVSIMTEYVSTDMWARNYVTQGAGSGVIISEDGYIMTCNHVIEDARSITVTLRDQTEYQATLIGRDPENDVAIIKIEAEGLSAANYGDSSKLQVGDQVVAIGNPLGELSGTATAGIISALSRDLTIDGQTMNLLQTDASINPGNSGGALFDSSGNLIGIVVAKSAGSDVEGLGFAIPINRAAEIGKSLIENGSPAGVNDNNAPSSENTGTPKIGITVAILTDEQARMNNLDGAGVYITSVSSENAIKAGLQELDKIVEADGQKIETFEDLQQVLKEHEVGESVELELLREGKTVTASVVLS